MFGKQSRDEKRDTAKLQESCCLTPHLKKIQLALKNSIILEKLSNAKERGTVSFVTEWEGGCNIFMLEGLYRHCISQICPEAQV